jgi:hypothetical protein
LFGVATGAVVEFHPSSIRLCRRRWAQANFSLNALDCNVFDTLGISRTELTAHQTVRYLLNLAEATRPVAYLAMREAIDLVESA